MYLLLRTQTPFLHGYALSARQCHVLEGQCMCMCASCLLHPLLRSYTSSPILLWPTRGSITHSLVPAAANCPALQPAPRAPLVSQAIQYATRGGVSDHSSTIVDDLRKVSPKFSSKFLKCVSSHGLREVLCLAVLCLSVMPDWDPSVRDWDIRGWDIQDGGIRGGASKIGSSEGGRTPKVEKMTPLVVP